MTNEEEFARLRLRYETLKEQVANQIEMYAHLVMTEGPNIEAQYMMCVGHLECQVTRLKMEVSRWRSKGHTLRDRAHETELDYGVSPFDPLPVFCSKKRLTAGFHTLY